MMTWSNTARSSKPMASMALARSTMRAGPSRYDTLGNSTEIFTASSWPTAAIGARDASGSTSGSPSGRCFLRGQLLVVPADGGVRGERHPPPVAPAGRGREALARRSPFAVPARVLGAHLTPGGLEVGVGVLRVGVLQHRRRALEHGALQFGEALVAVDQHGAGRVAAQVHDLLASAVEVHPP